MSVGATGVILHVDVEHAVRASMALLLRAAGYQVRSAATGSEAFRLASDGVRPDVLIVDFNLGPRKNGALVAERVQKLLHYAPPIIMLTGDVSIATVPRMTNVFFWLTGKPLNPQLLLAALPSLVQLSRATRAMLH